MYLDFYSPHGESGGQDRVIWGAVQTHALQKLDVTLMGGPDAHCAVFFASPWLALLTVVMVLVVWQTELSKMKTQPVLVQSGGCCTNHGEGLWKLSD